MFTKVLHLKEILNGVSYNTGKGYNLNRITDPGVVAIMARNIYEITGLFNLIYRHPKSDEEQDIVYNLWRYAGLRNRQRFEDSFEETDRKSVLEDEKQDMKRIIEIIKTNSYFLSLDKHNQDKIEKRLEKGQFLIQFVNKQVKVLHWQSLANVMEIKKKLFDNIYTYFSLYAHPSNVSVFQFDEMFSPFEQGYLKISNFNMKTTLCMIGIFIADYIHYFSNIVDVFNSLDFEDRVVIDFHNRLARGEGYSIIESEDN